MPEADRNISSTIGKALLAKGLLCGGLTFLFWVSRPKSGPKGRHKSLLGEDQVETRLKL